jgi:hypothetical protein
MLKTGTSTSAASILRETIKSFSQNSQSHGLEDGNLHSQSGEKIKVHTDDENECS